MAQTRFIKFRDPINSFEANEKYAGIIEPGVYRGFDRIVGVTGLDFSLTHEDTGEKFTIKAGNAQTDPRGIWVTKQGLVIKEDAPIPLTITPNPNDFERWDLLVGDHTYDELNPGGIPASYEIIVGTVAQTEPALDSPLTQVILGRIRVPANATGASGITWERRRVLSLGGTPAALLDQDNRFNGQIQENQAGVNIVEDPLLSKYIISELDGANSFLVLSSPGNYLDLLPNKPSGTRLAITFNKTMIVRGFSNQLDGSGSTIGYSDGLRPILIDPDQPLYSITVNAGDTMTLRKVNTTRVFPDEPFADYWAVESLTSNTALRRIIDRDSIQYLSDVPLRIRYTQTGSNQWTTDGLFKREGGTNVQEVINLPPPLLPGGANGILRAKILGRGLWNGTQAEADNPTYWPTDSLDRIFMDIQGIELILIPGWTPEANTDTRDIEFTFDIRMYKGVPYIIYKVHSSPGPTYPKGSITTGSGQVGDGNSLIWLPLPSIDLTQPIPISFRASPLYAPTLTTEQHDRFIDAGNNSGYNSLNWIEIKVISL